jgi:hypothetical protein
MEMLVIPELETITTAEKRVCFRDQVTSGKTDYLLESNQPQAV